MQKFLPLSVAALPVAVPVPEPPLASDPAKLQDPRPHEVDLDSIISTSPMWNMHPTLAALSGFLGRTGR